jgi:multidrug transporter EmrE-like cation transporter
VYAQVAMKLAANSMPEIEKHKSTAAVINNIFYLITNYWILSSFAAAFFAAIMWMFAVAKLPLSHAYPFLAMTFVGVLIMGNLVFMEQITWPKVIGVILIISGVIVSALSFEFD